MDMRNDFYFSLVFLFSLVRSCAGFDDFVYYHDHSIF